MLSAVYFLKNSAGLIKIGFTRDFETRRRSLERAAREQLQLLALVPGGSTLETKLHREFARSRSHGEWFAETPELLVRISELTRVQTAKAIPDKIFATAWRDKENSQTFLALIAGKIINDRSASVPRLAAIDNLAAATGVSGSFLRHLISDPSTVRAEADFMLRLVDCYEVHCVEGVAAAEQRARELREECLVVREWIDQFGLAAMSDASRFTSRILGND